MDTSPTLENIKLANDIHRNAAYYSHKYVEWATKVLERKESNGPSFSGGIMKKYYIQVVPSSREYIVKAKNKRDAIKKARARFRRNPGRTDAYCDELLGQ